MPQDIALVDKISSNRFHPERPYPFEVRHNRLLTFPRVRERGPGREDVETEDEA